MGRGEGFRVGDADGRTVGDFVVGNNVGCIDSTCCTVGSKVGDSVGDTEGLSVGELVVGDNVGAAVGDSVGDTVGDSVGDADTLGAAVDPFL